MAADKIVQFVSFETLLDTEKFITQWEQYNRSVGSDHDVSLQQSVKNEAFRYIAQHRGAAGELKFSFTRAKKSSRNPEPEIKARQAGGYLLSQEERVNDVQANETKVFVFLSDSTSDMGVYQQLKENNKLNIYEAYYENCQYAFILEYFVKNKYLPSFLEKLKDLPAGDVGVYKECALQPA